jgi:acyl-coenzyme A thioesterase PaaI-like protein
MSQPEHTRPDHTRPDLHADARAYFLETTGFEHDLDDDDAWGTVTIGPYLWAPGSAWPLAAALLTFTDVLIGRLASQRSAPRISVTADLGVRVVAPPGPGGRLDLRAKLVKVGRSMTVGRAEITSATSGELVATSLGTFLPSPRPADVAPDEFPAPIRSPGAQERAAATLGEQVGLRLLQPGVSEMSLRPDVANATQSLQGGMVALLGEAAALSATTAAAGYPTVTETLDVHYLAAARVGPFRARARILTFDAGRGLVEVEVRDPGRDDRLVSVISVGTRSAPTP